MGKLFGTDGIRGVANEYPLTREIAAKVGRAVMSTSNMTTSPAKIVMGKDTRISGSMLEKALASGICAMGGDVLLAGIVPGLLSPLPTIRFMTMA
jgi:phosphoglucosamine mutase